MSHRPARPAEHNSHPSPILERRAAVRYPRRLDMFWQRLGLSPRELTRACVFDLSLLGVGLLSDQVLPVGVLLLLRLPTVTAGWSSHLARVKRCTEQPDGRFQVGCTFARPLSAGELKGLLG